MKNIVWLLIPVLAAACGTKENNGFSVDGTLQNSPATMVYLEENITGKPPMIIDSSEVKDGKFDLAGSGTEQGIYSLRGNREPYPFALVINDTRKITVTADPSNNNDPYQVKGSPASQAIIDFDRNVTQRAHRIYQLAGAVDSLLKIKASDTLVSLPYGRYDMEVQSLKEYSVDFIEQASSPVLALYALGSYQRLSNQLGTKGLNDSEVNALIQKLSEKFRDHKALNELAKNLKPRSAPDFSLPDTSGNAVSLSSFRGKYVLVDFWASWCKPCRLENPNIVRAYNEFKDKNFTILGVSLDRERAPWIKAIANDGLTWTHISDLKYWNSAAAALYQVNSIPYNILVDPEGNIIAENLHGDELPKKLKEVLK